MLRPGLSNFFDIAIFLEETMCADIHRVTADAGAVTFQPLRIGAMAGKIGKSRSSSGIGLPVDGLARTVIRTLSEKPLAHRRKRLDEARVVLIEASCADGPFSNERLKEAMESLGIGDDDLIDFCIPDAARDLGEGWVDDTMSFAEVSRASARLHGFCRFLEGDYGHIDPLAEGFSILLVLLRREDHIIGPAVLAKQLRRTGNSVALMSNCTVDELLNRLGAKSYDCLMISLSSLVGLEIAATAISRVRQLTDRHLPIFLGGAVLDHRPELEHETGADLVTKDITVALDALHRRRGLEREGISQ